ncbi:MAG: hypothetical protein HQ472_09350 [Ignavibacteria bacterium]|nr:hypothetical protein [Ignavibacteria bacterium]
MEYELQFESNAEKPIYTTITVPDDSTFESARLPLVILIHGFKGFRSWGFFPYAARKISEAGFIAARIDTSMNGMNGTDERVVSVDDFANNTISQELADVHSVISGLKNLQINGELLRLWNGTIHIIGHSRGGGIAQLAMRDMFNADKNKLGKCVCWNSVGKWNRWSKRQIEQWKEAGSIRMENTRTGQELRLDFVAVQDLYDNLERFDLVRAARELKNSVRYIHADGDITVNIKEIQNLVATSGNAGALHIIPGSTHTFGITHPFVGTTPAFNQVLSETLHFLDS